GRRRHVRSDQGCKERLLLRTRIRERAAELSLGPDLEDPARSQKDGSLTGLQSGVSQEGIRNADPPGGIRHDFFCMAQEPAEQVAVGTARRSPRSDLAQQLIPSGLVIHQDAAIESGTQVEFPLLLGDPVQDARGQRDAALVIQAVLRRAEVGDHLVLTRGRLPQSRVRTLATTKPLSTTYKSVATLYHPLPPRTATKPDPSAWAILLAGRNA